MTKLYDETNDRRPFPSAVDPQRYFPSRSSEEARNRLARSIERGEGPAIVVAPAGAGKTMLLQVLGSQFASGSSFTRNLDGMGSLFRKKSVGVGEKGLKSRLRV